MDCIPQHATGLDDRAVEQVVAELADGGVTVVVGVSGGRPGPARRAIHGRATVVTLDDPPTDASVAVIAGQLETSPGRCVVVLRQEAGGWDLAVGAPYEPRTPAQEIAPATAAPPLPEPAPPWDPGRASTRSTVGVYTTLAAPEVMLGGAFFAAFCATGEIQPCYYPWTTLTASGAGAMVVGPILMLSGAERDRREISTYRGPSFADAGFVALAASGAFLVAAPLVEPEDAGTPIAAASIAWLSAVLLGSIQLTENHEHRKTALAPRD